MAFEKRDGVVHEFGLFECPSSHDERKIEQLFEKFGSVKGLKNLLRHVLVRSFGVKAGMFRKFDDIGVNYFFLVDPGHESVGVLPLWHDTPLCLDPAEHPAQDHHGVRGLRRLDGSVWVVGLQRAPEPVCRDRK